MDDILKVSSALGTIVTSVWRLVTQIQKRFARFREIRDRDGKLGLFFWFSYIIFQYVYGIGLIICGLAGLAALVGGILKVTGLSWAPEKLTLFFDSYSIPLILLTGLLVFIAWLNILSWIPILLLGWIPSRYFPLKQSASWHNLLEFSRLLNQPKPLFVNRTGIDRLADKAITRLMTAGAGAADFAETPTQLSAAERANAALIGCLLEREHLVQKWGWRTWRLFYAAVAAAERDGLRMVSPDYLKGPGSREDFYGNLREEINRRLPAEEPPLPDSPVAMNHVSQTISLLNARYKGTAKSIAYRSWWPRPSLRLAFHRAREFHPLTEESMIPQFLKLCVRWDVWPGVKVGTFVYPYASSITRLMLHNNALVTLQDADKFAFRKGGELAAYREVMRSTVRSVERILIESRNPQHQQYVHRLTSAGHPMEWELAVSVDFALWSLAREMATGGSFKEWEVDSAGFIVRKE